MDGWSKTGCLDLKKVWWSLTHSFDKYLPSDFYVPGTRYTETEDTVDPALKSLEVLWALKQRAGRVGSKWG